MEKQKCKLCDENKDICKSHIVPEFCYQTLYDKKHRFIQLTSVPGERTITRPQGLYDRLLCKDCEEKIAVYEEYFKHLITTEDLVLTPDKNMIKLSEVDSSKLKLFVISIIWRYFVSKFKSEDFDLGPHSSNMKQMLLDSDPGEWHQYGFFWVQGVTLPDSFSKAILLPVNKRSEKHRVILLVLLGVFWVVFTSKHAREHWLSEYFCRDGSLFVINDENNTKKWFSDMAMDLHQKGKLNSHP